MYDFECHYRKEKWPTARYFNFVKDFLMEAQFPDDSADCDPPPCPSAAQETSTPYATGECSHTLLLALILTSTCSFPASIRAEFVDFYSFIPSDVFCFTFYEDVVFISRGVSSHFSGSTRYSRRYQS